MCYAMGFAIKLVMIFLPLILLLLIYLYVTGKVGNKPRPSSDGRGQGDDWWSASHSCQELFLTILSTVRIRTTLLKLRNTGQGDDWWSAGHLCQELFLTIFSTINLTAAEGLLYQDWTALTDCQRECMNRLNMTIQLEQEAYLTEHPEVRAMLKKFISEMVQQRKRKDILAEAGKFFTRPAEVLDAEIRENLGIQPPNPYVQEQKPPFRFKDLDLEYDLKQIVMRHYPPEPWRIPTPVVSTPNTVSSDFLSIITSDTTLPTPEPVRTPDPTLSETLFSFISNTVDKAIFTHVDDNALRYDTAYVELMKAVEEAMEIPVIEIKEDIAELFYNAYKLFELDIMEKERIAAEIAWEKRMRKKLKRTLRRLHNFKGYEIPPTPKSQISSHESYKKPPPRPCVCHPQFYYNRYAKDRFGIYLPKEEEYNDNNVTVTPAISVESLTEGTDEVEPEVDTKSIMSKKSVVSGKKTTFKT